MVKIFVAIHALLVLEENELPVHFVDLFRLVQCKMFVDDRSILTKTLNVEDEHKHYHLISKSTMFDFDNKSKEISLRENFSFVVDIR